MSDDKLTKADELRALVERTAHYSASTIADETIKRYGAEFRQFKTWADGMGLPSLPSEPVVVATYLAALADGNVEVVHVNNGVTYTRKAPYKYASIAHAYTAIISTHRSAGHDWVYGNPVVLKVMRGIAMRKGTRKRKVEPLQIGDLKRVLVTMRERWIEDLTVVRDKALLTLCFFGAFRRKELVALNVDDLTFGPKGLVILVRKSKTDRLAEGEEVGILPQADAGMCPIALTKDWLAKSEITEGPVFRRIDRNGCIGNRALSGQAVADLVRQHANRIGLDGDNFAGHSLRAGFATSAAAAGKTLHNIMRQTRHKDSRVAMSYIRPATVLDDNATEGLGDDDE